MKIGKKTILKINKQMRWRLGETKENFNVQLQMTVFENISVWNVYSIQNNTWK